MRSPVVAILVGGRSRRFGSDKATHLLDGRAFVEHLVEAARGASLPVVLVGESQGRLPFGVAVLPDDPASDGPTAALAAALSHAEREGRSGVVLLACDQPGVPTALLVELASMAADQPDRPLALAGETGLEPFPAYYPTGLIDAAREQASLRGVLEHARPATRVVPVAERAELSDWALTNINTPADLEEFLRRRRRSP